MDVANLQHALDEVFDHALIYHAYTDYMRDYEMIIYVSADPRSGIAPVHLRYLFRYCVEAHARTAILPEQWRESLDDRLLADPRTHDLEGYLWGNRCQWLYPGAEIIPDSARAKEWAEVLGIDFHEVRFGTNDGHNTTLVFSDLQVTELSAGYTPFVVKDDTSAT